MWPCFLEGTPEVLQETGRKAANLMRKKQATSSIADLVTAEEAGQGLWYEGTVYAR